MAQQSYYFDWGLFFKIPGAGIDLYNGFFWPSALNIVLLCTFNPSYAYLIIGSIILPNGVERNWPGYANISPGIPLSVKYLEILSEKWLQLCSNIL